jgi:F-type H+-transporting ATPase subunit b
MDLFINIAHAATEAAEIDPGVLGTLGINWKLFLAQLVNFGIILFIFWRWVVRPLGGTLTARQKKIEEGLKNAEEMERERINFEKTKTEELKKVRAEAESIIKNATVAAEQMKSQILTEAQEQSAKMGEATRQQLAAEKVKMVKEAKAELAEVVVLAAEKIVREKLDEKKDKELIDESLRRAES